MPESVLFVCTHNASRSQMAEGLLRDRYGHRYTVHSAGTTPGGVHPMAVGVMDEIGVDLSDHTSESIDAYADTPHDVVVTVCDDAAATCAHVPPRRETLHRGFDDPSAVNGPDAKKRAAFRRVRDALAEWIDATFGPAAIRSAQAEDLDAICGLLERVGLPHDDLTPGHLGHFLVASGAEGVLGTVGLEPFGEEALLRSLAVAPEARDRGLGTRLVESIEQRAREKGIHTLYLLTTTAADYFRRHGYEPMERDALPEAIQQTDEAVRLCPASATTMRTEVAQPKPEA